MAITKHMQNTNWGATTEATRTPRPVGRPRIIVGLLTGDEVVDAPAGDRSDRGAGKPGR